MASHGVDVYTCTVRSKGVVAMKTKGYLLKSACAWGVVTAMASCTSFKGPTADVGETDRTGIVEDTASEANVVAPPALSAPKIQIDELPFLGASRSINQLRSVRFELGFADVDARGVFIEFVDPSGNVFERRQLEGGLVSGTQGKALVEFEVQGTFVQQMALSGAWAVNAYHDSGLLLASRAFEVLP